MYSQKICSNFEHLVNSFLSRIRGIPYGGVFFSNERLKKVIKRIHPDIVHVHCINANTINVYRFLKFLAKNRINTVVSLHAEIFYTAGCEHAYDCEKFKDYCHNCEFYRNKIGSWIWDRSEKSWALMRDAFAAFAPDTLIVAGVSPWLTERARQSSILRGHRVECVANGVDTNVFFYKKNISLISREHYEKIILFVTAYYGHESNDIKGGRYLPILAKFLPNYKFVIVATNMSRRLNEMPSNIQVWGRTSSQEELSQLYSEADATIILSKREAFSMVTAESLCCGTPVVGFRAGGPESIALKEYSKFVNYANVQALSSALQSCLSSSYSPLEISKKAIRTYSEDRMVSSFLKLYLSLSS